ncbi:hypothetical protein C2E23DRAFT_484873 [Lenzites betulinus]|nr:hypothetical protein C2E23DRAFT_484873 [Lenzites betulinus]
MLTPGPFLNIRERSPAGMLLLALHLPMQHLMGCRTLLNNTELTSTGREPHDETTGQVRHEPRPIRQLGCGVASLEFAGSTGQHPLDIRRRSLPCAHHKGATWRRLPGERDHGANGRLTSSVCHVRCHANDDDSPAAKTVCTLHSELHVPCSGRC